MTLILQYFNLKIIIYIKLNFLDFINNKVLF